MRGLTPGIDWVMISQGPTPEQAARTAAEQAPVRADLDTGHLVLHEVLIKPARKPVRDVHLDGALIGRLSIYNSGKHAYLQVDAWTGERWRNVFAGLRTGDTIEALTYLYKWRADPERQARVF